MHLFQTSKEMAAANIVWATPKRSGDSNTSNTTNVGSAISESGSSTNNSDWHEKDIDTSSNHNVGTSNAKEQPEVNLAVDHTLITSQQMLFSSYVVANGYWPYHTSNAMQQPASHIDHTMITSTTGDTSDNNDKAVCILRTATLLAMLILGLIAMLAAIFIFNSSSDDDSHNFDHGQDRNTTFGSTSGHTITGVIEAVATTWQMQHISHVAKETRVKLPFVIIALHGPGQKARCWLFWRSVPRGEHWDQAGGRSEVWGQTEHSHTSLFKSLYIAVDFSTTHYMHNVITIMCVAHLLWYILQAIICAESRINQSLWNLNKPKYA